MVGSCGNQRCWINGLGNFGLILSKPALVTAAVVPGASLYAFLSELTLCMKIVMDLD